LLIAIHILLIVIFVKGGRETALHGGNPRPISSTALGSLNVHHYFKGTNRRPLKSCRNTLEDRTGPCWKKPMRRIEIFWWTTLSDEGQDEHSPLQGVRQFARVSHSRRGSQTNLGV